MESAARDEVDLVKLLTDLWTKKWLIAWITATVSILFTLVHALTPQTFDGELRVTALTEVQMAGYQMLNNTPGISKAIYADGQIIGQSGVIQSQAMFEAFENQVGLGKAFSQAHIELDPQVSEFKGTENEFAQYLALIGQSYDFKRQEGSETTGTLLFKTKNPELAKAITEYAILSINEKIRIESLEALENLSRSISTSLKFELEEVKTEIENEIFKNQIAINARRAKLKENAAIARQIGNASGEPLSISGINLAIDKKSPLYLRGYKALEKEIALLDERSIGVASLPFIDAYPELAFRKRNLETDARLERIASGVNISPLNSRETFRAVDFDLGTLVFKPTSNRIFVAILGALIGALFAVLFVLTKRAFAAQQMSDPA